MDPKSESLRAYNELSVKLMREVYEIYSDEMGGRLQRIDDCIAIKEVSIEKLFRITKRLRELHKLVVAEYRKINGHEDKPPKYEVKYLPYVNREADGTSYFLANGELGGCPTFANGEPDLANLLPVDAFEGDDELIPTKEDIDYMTLLINGANDK